ncbi:hypothetical protein D4A92_03285 [Rhizobium rosettiformans]|uniref:Uncharacterized protein n=1 Tax=Rhizobium rosettiformans TaxID=1368430 RepID=A0ABX7ETQ6_9HYPH|nr:hypothetical protein [Rhizobium rosettiformans]QRF50541.1 hypothetical protein D4A92_03285 [Rhizobium rosettiformans]
MDGDEKGQGAANDNARPANNADGCVEEPRRAAGEHLERVVIDIARLIGRQMARADHAARVAANDNGDNCAGRDEPEAE